MPQLSPVTRSSSSQADGRLTSTSPGGNAIVVAHLIERTSASKITSSTSRYKEDTDMPLELTSRQATTFG
jgi:hypothetical protein